MTAVILLCCACTISGLIGGYLLAMHVPVGRNPFLKNKIKLAPALKKSFRERWQ